MTELTEIDLRDFPYMPLKIERLQKSKAWLECKREPELAFYLMNLWMRAWHELPAGSIEDDDDVLADAAMCPMPRWRKIRDKILRKWERRADGRLYHPVVTEIAEELWAAKCKQRNRTAAARAERQARRDGVTSQPQNEGSTGPATNDVTNSATADVTRTVTSSVTDNVTSSKGREVKGREGKESSASLESQPRGARDDLILARTRIVKAFEDANSPNPPDTSRVELWSTQGYDLEICIAVVTEGIKRKPSISNLKYFENQIKEAHESRPKSNGFHVEEAQDQRDARWRRQFDYWKRNGDWPFAGPNPDCAGCEIPKAKILEWSAP